MLGALQSYYHKLHLYSSLIIKITAHFPYTLTTPFRKRESFSVMQKISIPKFSKQNWH